jgi:hypothetical protein
MNNSWDPTWEQVFRVRDWARYPQEELIRFVAVNFYSAAERKKIKILDAGCGTGAGVWFIAREGFSRARDLMPSASMAPKQGL